MAMSTHLHEVYCNWRTEGFDSADDVGVSQRRIEQEAALAVHLHFEGNMRYLRDSSMRGAARTGPLGGGRP